MRKIIVIIALTLFFIISCKEQKTTKRDYSVFVDPFIGTSGHGHTFPGATAPYGMVQLSPDTRTETWDGCSGYHYSDKSILGFSHTHFSGTGGGGGGDIMFMPIIGKVRFNEGDTSNTKKGYRCAFSHENEFAEPGYYRVLLDDYKTLVELTATTRVGLHKYTFPLKRAEANILLDLMHGISDSVDSLFLEIHNREIRGYRVSNGSLAGNHTTYFVAQFSQPFKYYRVLCGGKESGVKTVKGKNVKAYFTFNIENKRVIMIKVALSIVSIDGALKNLQKEIPDWNFSRVKQQAKEDWNRELRKIEIEGANKKQMRIFYTAMYHAFIHPANYMDVDRRYRSTNGRIYTAESCDDYTTFSLWDTFRALHPLQVIINPARTNQFIRTFISRYKRSRNMPIMEFSGNEMYSMIGYHSLPVVADAYAKGVRDYDVKAAYIAMKQLAESPRSGKKIYKNYGYIPYDMTKQSVSKTLEYAFDDWCVARLAKDFNRADFEYFSQRGNFYRNMFCKDIGFMRPKDRFNRWLKDFDPMTADNRFYTEGNAYQYTPFVPQDIRGLIDLTGGDVAFEKWLDREFTLKMDSAKFDISDISGLIGQYAHGNEPSHHIAYLYNYVGAPWKTQRLIRQILITLYSDLPNGIAGNEDAGQMSAWYILSSLGLYSVTPGTDYYVFGSPLFKKVTINLENGKQFVIDAEQNGVGKPYIVKAELNGDAYNKTFIHYSDIVNGGKLQFKMSENPNKEYGKSVKDRPYSLSYKTAASPVIHADKYSFSDSAIIRMTCSDEKTEIRYTLDGSAPTKSSVLYSKPLVVKNSLTLKARGFSDSLNASYVYTYKFRKIALKPALNIVSVKHGVAYKYREGLCESTSELEEISVLKTGVMQRFNLDAVKDQRPFGYNFSGYIKAPRDGVYEFLLKANDGAILYIDDELILDMDGIHPPQLYSEKVGLKRGLHKIRVDYFQMGRAKSLIIKWKIPGKSDFVQVPTWALCH